MRFLSQCFYISLSLVHAITIMATLVVYINISCVCPSAQSILLLLLMMRVSISVPPFLIKLPWNQTPPDACYPHLVRQWALSTVSDGIGCSLPISDARWRYLPLVTLEVAFYTFVVLF